MKKLLLILGLILFTSNVKAQVINWVTYEYQADIKVFFTQYKYDADIIACKTKYKHQANKPGYWWWEGDRMDVGSRVYSSHMVNVFQVKYKYQADYVVYLSSHGYEIKLTDKYINEVWKR